MGGVRSDLAVLGLEPGADRGAIDQAFKRLMKQHHPDRPGGDSARAAEIIRAYRALRPGAAIAREVEFWDRPKKSSNWWRWAAIITLAAVGALVAASLIDRTTRSGPARIRADVTQELGLAGAREPELIGRPLNTAAIDSAADDARAVMAGSDEMELAQKSRDCHLDFRNRRDLAAFDRCVAFDFAVVLLQDRDPLRDQGPFSQVAVNRRHWSDAALLSGDSLAIDGRLDRIRLRVELRLAPRVPEPQPVPDPAEPEPDLPVAAEPVD